MRMLQVDDGQIVTASIEILKRAHQLWGYIRFKSGSATTRKYVGRVTSETREEALRNGWTLVRANKIVESFGWRWVEPKARAKR